MRHCLSAALLAALLFVPARGEEPKKAADDEGQTLVFFADSRPVLIRAHISIDGKPLMKAWNGLITDIFNNADANKDGILDKTELAKVTPPQEMFGGRQSFARPVMVGGGGAGIPGNKMTRDDLANYYRKNGGAPLQLARGDSNQQTMYRRAFLDLNGQVPTQGQAEALNKALFALLDTDKDGVLSRKELEAVPAILLRKDADDDDMITPGELQGQSENATGEYQLFLSGGSGLTPLAADGPLMLAAAREPSRELADALLKRYGSAESKKIGKLTAKDLGLEAETFKKLDADGDGHLDREELARFARRSPDAELAIALGGMQTVEVKLLGENAAGLRIDKDKGNPSLCIGNVCVVLRLGGEGGGTGLIRAPAAVEEDALYKMQFSAADGDNNGYLDAAESRRNGFFASNFKAMDADGDGKLYFKEVLAYLKSRKSMRDNAKTSCASLTFSDQGRGLFDILDADGDGRLSVREMRQAVSTLLKLDRDGDACLGPNEIPRRFQLGAQRGPVGGGDLSGVFAISTSGFMVAPPRPQLRAGPLWFRKMDRNGDSDVSRREFLGTDEQFRTIDKDGDGLISVKEAEEYDSVQRKKK